MMAVKDAIAYLFPEKADLAPVYRYLKGVGYMKFIRFMVMEKGLIKLLDRLGNKGYLRAVATNRTNTMEKVINDFRLGEYFDEVVTAAMVKNPKPDPEQLFKIMKKFGLEPDELMFIGDSDYDRRAARGAGTVFVAFKNCELEADFNVDSMDEIGVILGLN
jgi:HAD superfamily hydrolase (TIGR01549 family)